MPSASTSTIWPARSSVAESAAVNASPLILLARSGYFELLRVAADQIVVPDAVIDEIRRRGASDPVVQAADQASWLRVAETPTIPEGVLAWDLGAGESSVLAWALLHPGCDAILDDLAARRCAAVLRIPVRGTLGLVLVAKKRGLIAQARPVLERLREAGMYLSEAVLARALALVGE